MLKKVAAIVIVLAVMLTILVGCPGKTEEPDTDKSNQTGKEKLVIWTNLTAEAQITVLTKQFNELSSEMGVEVEINPVPLTDLYSKMATAKESGTLPDIMHTAEASVAYLEGQGVLECMDDIINELGRDDFMESALNMNTVDGKVWGVPDWVMHTSVWYRKDLFAKYGLNVPQNWEEFAAVASALNIDTNEDGEIDIYGFPVPMDAVLVATQTYYPFLYANGLTTLDPSTGEYVFGDNIEEEVEIMEYIMDLFKASSPPASISWTWSDYRNALVEGNVAMTLDMGAVVGLAQTNNPDMVVNLGCFDLPGKDGPAKATFGGTYNFVVINQGGDAKVALAKEFVKKLYVPERTAERALSRPMFAFPSQNSAFAIYKDDVSVQPFQTEMTTIYNSLRDLTWYAYGMESGLNQLNTSMQATTFFGEAMQSVALNQMTSQEAVEYIDQKLQEQIQLINP
ncbi:MAG TPA: extracellular solute-binding protein [Clostridiaceae bacterium]|nr:extracellular solute-binding protein [Clostridiaceae bacterium]